jgi:hypothetical protein
VFLYLGAAGSGAFAIDRLRAGRGSFGQPAHGQA